VSIRGPVPAVAVAIVLLLAGLTVLASSVGPASPAPPGPDAGLPLGQGRVRTDKNCYLPGQTITITLKNVGSAPLVYSSRPDFEVENETIGTVRMVRDWQMGGFHLNPGDSMTWTWDQKWRAWDPNGQELNKGMFVPRGLYIVLAEALVGFPISDLVEIARSRFSIGDCLAQITAGDDIAVGENESFQFHPRIDVTGDASITSVTWDLDPAVDSNGDGNPTNDIDLAGRNPTYAFGDDGVYSVVMNVRGFGKVSGMDRPAQDTIFAIDSSDSMQWRDPFDHRKIAVKDYVDWMVPDDRGAVVDIDAAARLVRGDHLGMDYARIKSNVDMIDSAGGLYLASGLFVSLYELRDYGDAGHRWIIIFLTGAETENFRDPFYIPRAIDLAKDVGVTIYTVGLSIVEVDSITLMRTIASETGGRYFSSATASNLRQIYDDIAADANTSQGSYFTVSDALSVIVGNRVPILSIDPAAPLNVTLEAVLPANVSDPGTDDVTLVWDWGDGRSDTRTVFNDGVGPDPYPSPWGTPPAFLDVGRHVYRRSGDYLVTLTATDDDGGTSSTSVTVHVSSSEGMKEDAIARLKALKEQALARGDKHLLHELDEAETHVWKSLGYTHPFRPDSVAVAPAADVSVRVRDHDKVEVTLGPSWDSRLASYSSLRILWSNEIVTTLDLPANWPDREAEFRVRPWIDARHQDVRVESEREHKRAVTVEIHAHEASLGFGVYFDSDGVANLFFTYDTRPLWLDGAHLSPKLGQKVFDEEKKAVQELLCGGDREGEDDEDDDAGGGFHDLGGVGDDDREHDGRDRDDDDDDHEGCGDDDDEDGDHDGDREHEDRGAPATTGCPADPKKWNDTERAALDSECDLIANLLVKADEFLALTAIQDAKDTAIQNPKNAKHVAHEIAKAEKELARAYKEWDEHEYDDAIQHLKQAWKHAQHAIKDAMRRSSPHP